MNYKINDAKISINPDTFQPELEIDLTLLLDIEPLTDGEALGNRKPLFDANTEEEFFKNLREYIDAKGIGTSLKDTTEKDKL